MQFSQNTFSKNQYDIYISSGATIRPHQGDYSSGADNKFTGTLASSIYFQNTQQQSINYSHSSGTNRTPFNPTNNVTVVGNAASGLIISTLCNHTPFKAGAIIDSIEQYKMMQEQYDKLLAELGENPKVLQELLVLSDAMRELSDHAISNILQDSILYLESLKQWYEVVRTPIAKYLLAEIYAYEGKFDQSDAILEKIPAIFDYGKPEMEEHDNYMSFHNFKKNMTLSEKSWTSLDEKEITQLQTIAETTKGRSATMAQGVLCFFYDICYDDKAEGGSIPPKNVDAERRDAACYVYTDITIFPNPAQAELIINSNNSAVKIVQVEIYDLFGRKVFQQTLNQSSGKIGLNVFPQGILCFESDVKSRRYGGSEGGEKLIY